MQYEVTSNSNTINWNAKGNERIIQNVLNIINLIKYDVPYLRAMGRNSLNLDKAVLNIKETLIEETFDLIEIYEPRVTVKDVTVEDDMQIKVVMEVD